MHALVKSGDCTAALDVWRELLASGVRPTVPACGAALNAMAKNGASRCVAIYSDGPSPSYGLPFLVDCIAFRRVCLLSFTLLLFLGGTWRYPPCDP